MCLITTLGQGLDLCSHMTGVRSLTTIGNIEHETLKNPCLPDAHYAALIHKLLGQTDLIGLHGGIPPPTSFPLTSMLATELGGTSLAITDKEQVCPGKCTLLHTRNTHVCFHVLNGVAISAMETR